MSSSDAKTAAPPSPSTMKRLADYDGKLDSCIRCGYCYEHCPIYRNSQWESDSPRGKLIILHGLLHGELPASAYAAEKIFSCFHCKRCESVCSADVPFTEILAAARADLVDAGAMETGTTAELPGDECVRCLHCLRMCPHDARSWAGGETGVAIDHAKCQGCGNCVDVCPRQTIRIHRNYGTDRASLEREVKSFLSDEPTPHPQAIVFACNWSTYGGLQHSLPPLSGTGKGNGADPECKILVNVCAGRLHSAVLLEALKAGAAGVLVTTCPEDECHHEGNRRAAARVAELRKTLGAGGIDPARLQITEVSPGQPAQFNAKLTAFLTEIRDLGVLGAP